MNRIEFREVQYIKISAWQGLTQIDVEHAASDKKIVHHACKEILANGHNPPYQLPLKFNVLLHVAWLMFSISRHVPLSGHDDVALFEWRR